METAMGDAVVRPARVDDATAIGELHVRSWQAAYADVLPATVLDRLSTERRAAFWRETIARQVAAASQERTWVIEVEGRIVGVAEGGRARDTDAPPGSGELHAIYLAPEAWSRGLGSRLFEQAVEELSASGLDPLVLWVLASNERARSFYERHSWATDGSTRELDFDGTPVTEVRYRRATPAPDR
jgi:ribosomal protein S18 acetylase RimI-like enzyme